MVTAPKRMTLRAPRVSTQRPTNGPATPPESSTIEIAPDTSPRDHPKSLSRGSM